MKEAMFYEKRDPPRFNASFVSITARYRTAGGASKENCSMC